jgi:AcrR family transcriptional regulator
VPDRRAELKARHRHAILDAADSLIRERGKPQFSVDELAERADVSRRTVFNHFSSLDDVILTSSTRAFSGVLNEFRTAAAAAPAGDGSRVALFAEITAVVRDIDLPGVVAYLSNVLSADANDSRSNHALGDVIVRATDQLTSEISERSSEIDEFDAAILVSSLMNGIAVVASRWIAETGGSLDQGSRQVWDALFDRLITNLRIGYAGPD